MTATTSWLQIEGVEAENPVGRASWLQIEGSPAGAVGGATSWLQIEGSPSLETPVAPATPQGVATGATSATLTLTDNSGGLAAHRWQAQLVGSGVWAEVTGPSGSTQAAGAAALDITGLSASGEYLVRARSELYGGLTFSAWVQSATSFWTHSIGDGETPVPELGSILAISAQIQPFDAALAFTGPAGYRGDSLTASGVTGNVILPLISLPADNAVLFRAELISTSLPGGALLFFADGRYIIDPATPNGSYGFTFRWFRDGVAQSPLVTQSVQIGPSGFLTINAQIQPFDAALSFEVPSLPLLTINAQIQPFDAALSFGTLPSVSVHANMGSFLTLISFIGDIAGTVPSQLSTARQYRVNPDVHLDAYSIQQGFMLSWEKDPEASLDYSIDWADWLADIPGDALANMFVTNSAGLSVTAQAIRGAVSAVVAKGGAAGAWEFVTIRIITTQGRIDERTIKLLIKER